MMKIDFQDQKITIYFVENLKYLLKKSKVTYKELLVSLGYESDMVFLIGQWVNGIETPDLEDLVKLALIFKVGLEEMITVDLEKQDSLKS